MIIKVSKRAVNKNSPSTMSVGGKLEPKMDYGGDCSRGWMGNDSVFRKTRKEHMVIFSKEHCATSGEVIPVISFYPGGWLERLRQCSSSELTNMNIFHYFLWPLCGSKP